MVSTSISPLSILPYTYTLSQAKYIYDLLSKHNFLDSKPTASHESSTKLDHLSGDLLPDPSLYRSMVGALQYLTWTRPDIAHAVNQACQHMHSPQTPHLIAAKRIFRYLKGTPDLGITFTKGPIHLTVFTDADWAGCPIHRRSTSGHCIFLGPNLISWRSKKQSSVSRSSTEAEYHALAQSVAEVLWLCFLLRDLHVYLPHAPLLYCDNVSAIALATNPILHNRTKHIDVDFHFIREPVAQKSIQLSHISTFSNVADVFTKSLPLPRFLQLISKLIVRLPSISLRRGGGGNTQLKLNPTSQD